MRYFQQLRSLPSIRRLLQNWKQTALIAPAVRYFDEYAQETLSA